MNNLNKKIVLCGYSGHAYVLAEAIFNSNLKILGYDDKNISDNNPFGLNYLGYEKDKNFKYWDRKYNFVIGIGDQKTRLDVSKYIRSKSEKIINIFHPSSLISENTELGNGIFIARNAVVNTFCKIGNDVIINTSASIDHECIIESGVHVAPSAVVLGNVKIGINSFIGANSTIKQGVNIGSNVIVGAGSVVLNDVPDNTLVYGNPAKQKL